MNALVEHMRHSPDLDLPSSSLCLRELVSFYLPIDRFGVLLLRSFVSFAASLCKQLFFVSLYCLLFERCFNVEFGAVGEHVSGRADGRDNSPRDVSIVAAATSKPRTSDDAKRRLMLIRCDRSTRRRACVDATNSRRRCDRMRCSRCRCSASPPPSSNFGAFGKKNVVDYRRSCSMLKRNNKHRQDAGVARALSQTIVRASCSMQFDDIGFFE